MALTTSTMTQNILYYGQTNKILNEKKNVHTQLLSQYAASSTQETDAMQVAIVQEKVETIA